MHVIYVHGVSERPDTYEFDKALRQRRQAFAHFVSKRLDRGIISFEAAGWAISARTSPATGAASVLAVAPTWASRQILCVGKIFSQPMAISRPPRS